MMTKTPGNGLTAMLFPPPVRYEKRWHRLLILFTGTTKGNFQKYNRFNCLANLNIQTGLKTEIISIRCYC
jgi:hypothetical protein